MVYKMLCLDRRFASYEKEQVIEPLPYGPLSYWLNPALYLHAELYFVNFATDDPQDRQVIAYLTEHTPDFGTIAKLQYQFVEPNIIIVNIGGRVIHGNISMAKTTAITYNAGSDGTNRMIYPIDIQALEYKNNNIYVTVQPPKYYPLAKSLSLQWTVSQSKYRTDSVYVPLQRIKKIKLMDFVFCDWLFDKIPVSGARYTLLINEYNSDAFYSAAGNYHFIFNTQIISAPTDGASHSAYRVAHLEGCQYAGSGYIFDNHGEYVFNTPVDPKDTLTVTLGIMGAPLALKSQVTICAVTFWTSLNNYLSSFQVRIKGDIMRQLVNGFLTTGSVKSVLYIDTFTTSEPELDAQAIRYITSPNGFIFYTKTQVINYGLPQRPDPAGQQSPFGYVAALLKKSGESYPDYPTGELKGKILTSRAYLGLLNFRIELCME